MVKILVALSLADAAFPRTFTSTTEGTHIIVLLHLLKCFSQL